MNRKRYAKCIVAVVMGIVMMLSAGTTVCAFEDNIYHELRDGDISLYLPESWNFEEIGADEDESYAYERIADAWNDEEPCLNLSIYYIPEDAQGDYFYIDDDEVSALTYYEEYGESALHELPMDSNDALIASWETTEPEFFDGEVNGFLVTELNGTLDYGETRPVEQRQQIIYSTVSMTDDSESMVHMFLVFYNDDGSALTGEQSKLAREIADGFYDYNYYNELARGESGDSLWSGGFDMNSGDEMDVMMTIIIGLVSILAPLGIIVAVIVIIAKRGAEKIGKTARSTGKNIRSAGENGLRGFSANFTGFGQSFDLGSSLSKWKKRPPEKISFSNKDKRTERHAERRSTMQMRTREAESAEKRYFESLQTLHKAGLLTREELQDMLERHERSRAWQRKK